MQSTVFGLCSQKLNRWGFERLAPNRIITAKKSCDLQPLACGDIVACKCWAYRIGAGGTDDSNGRGVARWAATQTIESVEPRVSTRISAVSGGYCVVAMISSRRAGWEERITWKMEQIAVPVQAGQEAVLVQA